MGIQLHEKRSVGKKGSYCMFIIVLYMRNKKCVFAYYFTHCHSNGNFLSDRTLSFQINVTRMLFFLMAGIMQHNLALSGGLYLMTTPYYTHWSCPEPYYSWRWHKMSPELQIDIATSLSNCLRWVRIWCYASELGACKRNGETKKMKCCLVSMASQPGEIQRKNSSQLDLPSRHPYFFVFSLQSMGTSL